MTSRGLLDTSVFIATESGRPARLEDLPDESYVSVVTLAELDAGVLAALDVETRHRRLATVRHVAALVALPVDAAAAGHWARLRVLLHEQHRRINVNDLWIASVALAHDMPIVSQDADFDVLEELGQLAVVRI